MTEAKVKGAEISSAGLQGAGSTLVKLALFRASAVPSGLGPALFQVWFSAF